MHSFEYEGVAYRSLREFCRVKGVSYQLVQRLRRKYVRAWQDVPQAIRWALGVEQVNFVREQKSGKWVQDAELSNLRGMSLKLRIKRTALKLDV